MTNETEMDQVQDIIDIIKALDAACLHPSSRLMEALLCVSAGIFKQLDPSNTKEVWLASAGAAWDVSTGEHRR